MQPAAGSEQCGRFHLSLDDLFPAVSACLRKVIQHDGSALVLFDEATAALSRPRAEVCEERVLYRGRAGRWRVPARKSPAGIAISTRQAGRVRRPDLQARCGIADCPAPRGAKAYRRCARCRSCRTIAPWRAECRPAYARYIQRGGRRAAQPRSPSRSPSRSKMPRPIARSASSRIGWRRKICTWKRKSAPSTNFGEIVGDSGPLRSVLKGGRDRGADRLDRAHPRRDGHGQGADRPRPARL